MIALGDSGYLGLMAAGEIVFRAAQSNADAAAAAAAAAVSGDHTVAAASTTAMGGTKVFSLETSMMSKRLVDKLVAKNKVRSVMTVFDASIEDLAPTDIDGRRVHALIAEPYYYNALLPWHGLQFWCVAEISTIEKKPTPRLVQTLVPNRSMPRTSALPPFYLSRPSTSPATRPVSDSTLLPSIDRFLAC